MPPHIWFEFPIQGVLQLVDWPWEPYAFPQKHSFLFKIKVITIVIKGMIN